MNRLAINLLLASVLTSSLAGCASVSDFTIDPAEWFSGDWFGNKKKLPGDRRPVFPEGVPGVTRGVPPDLVKGYQPTDDVAVAVPNGGSTDRAAAVEEEKPKPKAKPKPKPKVAAKPTPPDDELRPTPVTVRRAPAQAQQQPAQQQPAGGQWPEPPPPQRQTSAGPQWPDPSTGRTAQPGSGVQWPDPPAR